MADLFSTLTDKGVLDKSQIEQWKDGVILLSKETNYFSSGSPLVSQFQKGDSSIATFLKFSQLSNGSSALTDGEEVTSEAITDAEVNLTLAEYGNVVTTTSLGHIVTGGRLNPAAAELVGHNMGTSLDKIAIAVGEAGSNELIVTQSAESSLTASDFMTDTYVDKAYNKLRRSNIAPLTDGLYGCVMHPDVVHDLKAATAAGDWYDVNKYTNPEIVNRSRFSIFKGFLIYESSNVTINGDAGASAVDTYHTQFFGYNAFGYAESASKPPMPTLVEGTDKLNRFVHLGWYGVLAYGLVDTNAHWLVTSASSVGANT